MSGSEGQQELEEKCSADAKLNRTVAYVWLSIATAILADTKI
jgi:hypothetical protein